MTLRKIARTESFKKDYKRLQTQVQSQLIKQIQILAANPFHMKSGIRLKPDLHLGDKVLVGL